MGKASENNENFSENSGTVGIQNSDKVRKGKVVMESMNKGINHGISITQNEEYSGVEMDEIGETEDMMGYMTVKERQLGKTLVGGDMVHDVTNMCKEHEDTKNAGNEKSDCYKQRQGEDNKRLRTWKRMALLTKIEGDGMHNGRKKRKIITDEVQIGEGNRATDQKRVKVNFEGVQSSETAETGSQSAESHEVSTWNCCGLGNPRVVRALKELIKIKDPHVIFICETKLCASRLEIIRVKCGMQSVFGVDAIGNSRGLAMFWREVVELSPKSFSESYIDFQVTRDDRGDWRLTGLYGELDHSKREE
ncbi:hypothetical protein DITRI_Ditri06bG0094300 [Diplodiscus trichospermus]